MKVMQAEDIKILLPCRIEHAENKWGKKYVELLHSKKIPLRCIS